MANPTSILSQYMSLPVPIPGVDPGPQYALDINACMALIDQHNHAPGYGNQLSPSSLLINSAFSFNNQPLTNALSITFTPTSASPGLFNLHVEGVDLYFEDGNGNDVRMTAGGLINATASGLSSGNDSATFISNTLVVASSTTGPINISGASLLMGNRALGSKFLTLSPPSAMASSYPLVLPPANASGATQVMTLDTSGNMGSISYDTVGQRMTAVGANAIAATMNATGADAIAATRTRNAGSSTEGVGGVAISSSSGNADTSSSSFVAVTNLSVTLTTSGRPVQIGIQTDATNPGAQGIFLLNNVTGPITGIINILRGTTVISSSEVFTEVTIGGVIIPWLVIPPGSLNCIDVIGAGTYTYSVQYKVTVNSGSPLIGMVSCILTAYEL